MMESAHLHGVPMVTPYATPRTKQWILAQVHNTPASPTSPVAPHSDKAVELNNMYLDTKTNMLEIIEEGLQLKLEIQNIQDKFKGLVDDLETYEKKPIKMPVIQFPGSGASGGILGQLKGRLQQAASPSVPARGTNSKADAAKTTESASDVSAARARVRSLYEARKARIMSKRAGTNLDDLYSRQCMKGTKMQLREGGSRRKSQQAVALEDEEDKENNPRLHFATSTPAVTGRGPVPCPPALSKAKNLLTPIREENFESAQKLFAKYVPQFIVHRRDASKGRDKKSRRSAPPLPGVVGSVLPAGHPAGDYVTLKSPARDYINLSSPEGVLSENGAACRLFTGDNNTGTNANRDSRRGSRKSRGGSSRDSVSPAASSRVPTAAGVSPGGRSDSCSPVKYALSDTISELYTSKCLKDVSTISHISRTSLREQVSSANLSGNFHSTFNYPLHSTLNYPLSSTFNICGDAGTPRGSDFAGDNDDTEVSIDVDVDVEMDRKSVRTSVSEPSAAVATRGGGGGERLRPRALDDSYMAFRRGADAARQGASSAMSGGRPATPPPAPTPIPVLTRRSLDPADFRTPTKKPQPTLCKEHGLHPTFGGPCIFEEDSLGNTSSPEEDMDFTEVTLEEDGVSELPGGGEGVTTAAGGPLPAHLPHPTPTATRGGRCSGLLHHGTETDCDSSYLSECLDGDHTSVGLSEGEEYTATYDHRQGRMKMLKRQTGQHDLQQVRQPVGLSESDLFFDISRKHFSIEATRASLPDLSGMSTLQDDGEGLSESTLHASPTKHVGDARDDADSTLISVDVDVSRRPLSISTNDDSPESNTGLPVPVNSPNVTDSGGSSSRPNTDSYDYVDLPQTSSSSQGQRNTRDEDLMPPPPAGMLPGVSRLAGHSYYPNPYPKQQQQRGVVSGQRSRSNPASLHSHRSHPSSAPSRFAATSTATGTTTSSSGSGSSLSSSQDSLHRRYRNPHQQHPHHHHHHHPHQQPAHHSHHHLPAGHSQQQHHHHNLNNNYLSQHGSKRRLATLGGAATTGAAAAASGAPMRHHSTSRGLRRAATGSRADCDSGCSTYASARTAPQGQEAAHPPPALLLPPAAPRDPHFVISDPEGNRRTVIQHSAVARNLPKDRKKALVKKLKKFSNNFYKATSTGNLQIQTLGHF